MSDQYSPFANIGNVTHTEKSPFFIPGEFVCKVVKTQIGNSQQGKGPFFVAEVEVLASSTSERAVTSKMSWPLFFSHGDVVLANIKAFLAAVLGVDQSGITPEICDQVTSGDGTTLAGRTVRASASNIKTRAGKDFTVINWSTLSEENLEAEIKRVNQASQAAPASHTSPVAPLENSAVPHNALSALMSGKAT